MELKSKYLNKNSIVIKVSIIAVLTLLMLIPLSMVKSLIQERKENKSLVQNDITSKWGGKQHLTGPILVIPYLKNSAGNATASYAYFLPEEYKIDGDIKPEQRSRGIYNVLCYQSDMTINGSFKFPDYEKLNIKHERVLWQDAFILIGVPYLQGIKNKIFFNINGKPQEVLSSVRTNDLIKTGLTVKMPINPENKSENFKFDFKLSLNGSEGIYFTPIGKQTSIHMVSDYNSAKFTGDFLPNTPQDGKEGFDAKWDIYDYNRNYAQMWTGENEEINNSTLGIDLLIPIDQYQKNMRSAKYAILFIALTFLVFFVVEMTSRNPMHPVQYLLVSFALVLFYCLLLAFSEHIGFDWSYLISSIGIVSLITTYSHSIFKTMKQTIFMTLFLIILYVFLYVVIQLEDLALLIGSVGLFAALAGVMYASRKIKWYNNNDSTQSTNIIS